MRHHGLFLLPLTSAAWILRADMSDEFEEFWRAYTSNPLRGRNVIVSNICPQLCGVFMVKLAVVLCLIGGAGYVDKSGASQSYALGAYPHNL